MVTRWAPWVCAASLIGLPFSIAAEPPPEPRRTAPPTPTLPVGVPSDVPFVGDRPLRVAHAAPEITRAIVYLHGMCGAEKGADSWADLAAEHGTLITLRADVPCPDRPGYKWPSDPAAIEARIARALETVRELRGGALDTERVTLFGYSQGAHRAEKLAAAYPWKYRRLLLGGPPTAASPDRLRHSERVAVLGGELEDTSHMLDGFLELRAAGIAAEFFELPRAGHGGYGPEGRRVVGEALDFTFGR